MGGEVNQRLVITILNVFGASCVMGAELPATACRTVTRQETDRRRSHQRHGHQPKIWKRRSWSQKAILRKQAWRATGGTSDFPALLESHRTSQNFPELPQKIPGDFPETSLTVPGSSLDLPRATDLRRGQPLSLGSLTPSDDLQIFSLKLLLASENESQDLIVGFRGVHPIRTYLPK